MYCRFIRINYWPIRTQKSLRNSSRTNVYYTWTNVMVKNHHLTTWLIYVSVCRILCGCITWSVQRQGRGMEFTRFAKTRYHNLLMNSHADAKFYGWPAPAGTFAWCSQEEQLKQSIYDGLRIRFELCYTLLGVGSGHFYPLPKGLQFRHRENHCLSASELNLMQCQKLGKIFTGMTYKLLLSFTAIPDVCRSSSPNITKAAREHWNPPRNAVPVKFHGSGGHGKH